MTIKQYTLATLVANIDSLTASDPMMLLAARWGLLPEILTQADYDDRYDDADEWYSLWAAHRDAGHPEPDYKHTSDDSEVVDGGGVWGCDYITICGYMHEECWFGCYGGEHGDRQYGWGGPAADAWDVSSDNTGSSSSPLAEGFARAYDIDLDDGQPSEPQVEDCAEPQLTEALYVIVPGADGPTIQPVHYGIGRHPWDTGDERDDDGRPVESLFPQRWGCSAVEDDCESRRELMAAIHSAVDVAWESSEWTQPDECIHHDDDDAGAALLRHWAEVARQHDEPQEVELMLTDDTPYIRAVGHGEDMHYHLDLAEARALALHGWAAILAILQEAWGSRILIDSLTEMRERADGILASQPEAVWVTIGSSEAAGNCQYGTRLFAARHGLYGMGAVQADYLLSLAEGDPDYSFARRAARAAALGLGHDA